MTAISEVCSLCASLRSQPRRSSVSWASLPWRVLVLAAILSVVGALLILFYSLIAAGIIVSSFVSFPDCSGVQHEERRFQMLFVGLLMFVPGFYHLRLAFYAMQGREGYHFSDIPDFD